MPDITVVFTHWKRPENLKLIIEQIRTQTLYPKIFLWNNGGDFDCAGIDWRIDSSFNAITWGRWFMASMAQTEYVAVMDDDLVFTDSNVLKDAVDFLRNKNENMIIGPFGVNLRDDFSEYCFCSRFSSQAGKDQYVDMILGRLMIMRTKALKNLHLIPGWHKKVLLGDDLVVSAMMARGKGRFHCVPTLFNKCLKELPCPFASSSSSDHFVLRDEVRRDFFRPNLFEKVGAVCKLFRKSFLKILRLLKCGIGQKK